MRSSSRQGDNGWWSVEVLRRGVMEILRIWGFGGREGIMRREHFSNLSHDALSRGGRNDRIILATLCRRKYIPPRYITLRTIIAIYVSRKRKRKMYGNRTGCVVMMMNFDFVAEESQTGTCLTLPSDMSI